jgi:hypothetical protein
MESETLNYRNLKEKILGIDDGRSKQGLIASDLCRQIFEKFGYTPVKHLVERKSPGFFDVFNYGNDYGVNDIISYEDLPEEDTLNLKHVQTGRFNGRSYTIDYRSNNMHDINSVYIKLMDYNNPKQYLPSYDYKGRTIDPICDNIRKDKDRWEKAKKKGKGSIKSSMGHYYKNTQLLSVNNKSDFFFFVKYNRPDDVINTSLKVAYLVPAEDLRMQVARILNDALNECGYNDLITLEKDFYLNHKIMKAFQICQENQKANNTKKILSQMELFKLPRGDITLRIPENLLIPHIKFNSSGEIVYNYHLE